MSWWLLVSYNELIHELSKNYCPWILTDSSNRKRLKVPVVISTSNRYVKKLNKLYLSRKKKLELYHSWKVQNHQNKEENIHVEDFLSQVKKQSWWGKHVDLENVKWVELG